MFFKGTKGTIMAGVYGDSPRIIPEAKMREAKLPDKTLPRVEGSHEMDWVRACKSGDPAGADFAYSGPLTEICCLGNIAKRVDARIEWDAANLKVTNLPEANAFVRTRVPPGLGTVTTGCGCSRSRQEVGRNRSAQFRQEFLRFSGPFGCAGTARTCSGLLVAVPNRGSHERETVLVSRRS